MKLFRMIVSKGCENGVPWVRSPRFEFQDHTVYHGTFLSCNMNAVGLRHGLCLSDACERCMMPGVVVSLWCSLQEQGLAG